MRRANHQVFQEVALFFIVIYVGLQLKVTCFLQPNSRPDDRYLGFTQEATAFSPAQEYDYIIVGGGTAGCPLAATLSKNYSVLLLERGGLAGSDPDIVYENRSINLLLYTNNHDDSPAQNFITEDGVINTRGRVLGGTSMINYGFYSRADDYFYENAGIEWDMSDVKSAYEWVENSVVTRTDRDGLSTFQASTYNALVEAGIGPDNGFILDHVQGAKVGGSIFDGSGIRHGAVELLSKGNPENLKAVVHAAVDRVIFSTSKPLAAVGVIYRDSTGTNHEVRVRRDGEVILSAGSIGSPQLLLLSGLGPNTTLSSLNIPVVRDHPFVGQFMADNPRIGINLLVPRRLTDVGVHVAGITKSSPYVESTVVPPVTTIIPFIPFLDVVVPQNLSAVIIAGKVSRPISTGSLNLVSSFDVTVSPRVRFNYFSQPEDLLQCVDLVGELKKILGTQAMEEYKFPSVLGPSNFSYIGPSLPEDSSNNESVETFCRNTLSSFLHNHGGCLVNKVVDSQLKVIGVNSLRVVDASTFFNSPGTNPMATLLMLGRYIDRDGLSTFQASTYNALVEAGIGPDNGFILDHVQGAKVGGSIFDGSGIRHGAVELLSKGNPENLKAVVHAAVDRVIFSTSKPLAAVGVIYRDSTGTNHEVRVRRDGEVILSAGSIGSPQLLLLSGLGPNTTLSSLNIPVVRDHPFVGQFMADNPRIGINLLVPRRLTDVGVHVAGITKSSPYVESTVVPPVTTIIPFIPFLDVVVPQNLSAVIIAGKVSRPISTGSLNLVSSFDVTVSPRVRFNYFSQPEDLLQCVDLVGELKKILGTQAMEEYKFPSVLGPSNFSYIGPSLPEDSSNNESVETFCRNTLSSFLHNHGGCLVNKVVDSQLKVIGVNSLRVVDASTFFNSPGTNPMATLLMLGRYIGEKILNERAKCDINS